MTYTTGRSSTEEISGSVMGMIESTMAFETGVGVSGEGSASREVNFSEAALNSLFTESGVDEVLALDLTVPNYVYQKYVRLQYQTGRQETIKGNLHISSEPEPYRKKVTFAADGITIVNTEETSI